MLDDGYIHECICTYCEDVCQAKCDDNAALKSMKINPLRKATTAPGGGMPCLVVVVVVVVVVDVSIM